MKEFPDPSDHESFLKVLNEKVDYCPETGVFRWKKTKFKELVGQEIRYKRNGYISVKLSCKKYLAHRLAWLIVHGEWPSQSLDHIDGDPANNRISNLRQVTQSQNCQNKSKLATNTSGHKNVIFFKRINRWGVRLSVAGTRYYGGYFVNKEDAIKKAQEMIIQHNKQYARF